MTLSTTRKKTGRPVVIVASTIGIEGFIRKLMAGKKDDDYLLSCFNPSVCYSASQRQNRLANYFNMMAEISIRQFPNITGSIISERAGG